MWRRLIVSGDIAGGAFRRPCRTLSTKSNYAAANSKPGGATASHSKPGGATASHSKPGGATASSSAAVDSLILRSLKDHYIEVSKMVPPPKVSPPAPFTIVKGSLDSGGPVLRRSYGEGRNEEEITISVMRLANIIPDGGDEDGQSINQMFVHVDVAKPGWDSHLHFLCGLYPDALGIHSVSLRPKLDATIDARTGSIRPPSKYAGPTFQDLNEKVRDAFHCYIDDRGVNESLFPFLQAWLYVKDHRNLMRWFKTVGTVVNERKTS